MFSSCLKKGVKIESDYYGDDGYKTIQKHLKIPAIPEDYTLRFPEYYQSARVRYFDNGVAQLGRVLFYDKNLSSDLTISCASCHKQEIGFSDDVALSIGVQNRETARNSLALGSTLNFAEYYGNPLSGGIPFFWDNRAFTVSEQSEQTLGNPLEMDMKMHEVVERVKSLEYYQPLFDAEYDGAINEENILSAISVFVNSIGSFNSKFDKALGDMHEIVGNTDNVQDFTFARLSESENKGKTLYVKHCGSCHNSTFGRPRKVMANNGLYESYEDEGVGRLSNIDAEIGKFKIPTLRNIALTGPYMHDGSIATLEDVIEHYSNGIKNHPNLDSELKSNNGQAIKFNFTAQQKKDLVAFLETLNDEELKNMNRFSDPFR